MTGAGVLMYRNFFFFKSPTGNGSENLFFGRGVGGEIGGKGNIIPGGGSKLDERSFELVDLHPAVQP